MERRNRRQSDAMAPQPTNTGRRESSNRRPTYSRFTQQELPACRPILTPKLSVVIFLVISVIFITIGAFAFVASRDVVQIVDEYQTKCVPGEFRNDTEAFIQSNRDKTCIRPLEVKKHMKQPIYVYYQLNNFHQNHRMYVRSRSDRQLRDPKYENDTESCKPMDKSNNVTIVPCGLIAWSLFNDTYQFTLNNVTLNVDKKGISLKIDREHKFGKNVFPKNFQRGPLIGGASLDPKIPLNEQEDLIVWMRTAPFPSFRKLWGKIEVDLEKGDKIFVRVQNNYNTYSFHGKKSLVLSTSSWLGGKNVAMGIAYLTAGGLCFVLAVSFVQMLLLHPRQLGDPSYLSWNRNRGGGGGGQLKLVYMYFINL